MLSRRSYIIGLAVTGTLSLVAIILLIAFSSIKRSISLENAQLTSSNFVYASWLQSKGTTHLKFYFFNITNSRSVLNYAKPEMKELGPYTYKMTERKVEINKHANDQIKYKQKVSYSFEPSMSCKGCTENDKVIQIYAVLAVFQHMLNSKTISEEEFRKLYPTLVTASAIRFYTVKELVWGYTDPLLKRLNAINKSIDSNVKGILNHTNEDRYFAVNKGVANLAKRGNIFEMDGATMQTVWTTNVANQIYGTDGYIFRPDLQVGDKLEMFVPEICRPLTYAHIKSMTVDKLTSYAYLLSQTTLTEAGNKDYCLNPSKCYKDGLLDLSTCISNTPIVISQPHFYKASPEYQSGVIGLQPSDVHQSSILVEPKTGFTFESSLKLQINYNLPQHSRNPLLQGIVKMIVPVMYFDKVYQTPYDFRHSLYKRLYTTPKTVYTVFVIILVVSLLSLVILGILFYKNFMRKEQKGYNKTENVSDSMAVVKS